jgi:hypothetical protein
MKKALSTDDWTIYNCHIHTFTKQHTPSQFLKFVLSDSKLGKINWFRIPVYVLLVLLYFAFIYILGGYVVLLGGTLTIPTLPAYAFLLLLEALLVRSQVLFGSDYYMVTPKRMCEKEVSVMLRSRLGEDLYKQIAYTNPKEFPGLEVCEKKVIRKKNPTRR